MGSLLNKRFVYNPETGEMDEIAFRPRSSGVLVMQDLQDFVSPIDGKVVHGRRGLREHNKLHDVTNPADFKETWAKNQRNRELARSTGLDDPRRKQAAIRAYNDLREGRAKRNR
jgi:hypothetical protein